MKQPTKSARLNPKFDKTSLKQLRGMKNLSDTGLIFC
jgi:hypothetical protein